VNVDEDFGKEGIDRVLTEENINFVLQQTSHHRHTGKMNMLELN
jgi:hypothetical protein